MGQRGTRTLAKLHSKLTVISSILMVLRLNYFCVGLNSSGATVINTVRGKFPVSFIEFEGKLTFTLPVSTHWRLVTCEKSNLSQANVDLGHWTNRIPKLEFQTLVVSEIKYNSFSSSIKKSHHLACLHYFFCIRMLFFRPRLNVLILGWIILVNIPRL